MIIWDTPYVVQTDTDRRTIIRGVTPSVVASRIFVRNHLEQIDLRIDWTKTMMVPGFWHFVESGVAFILAYRSMTDHYDPIAGRYHRYLRFALGLESEQQELIKEFDTRE